MIAIIRIAGIIKIPNDVQETLARLRINKKFSLTLVREKPEIMGMIQLVRNFVAYGKIEAKTLEELIAARGKAVNSKGKIDAKKIASELIESKTDKMPEDFGLRNFFRLHPPRGGISSKQHYPKGVLGENKGINELIRRML